MRGWGGIPEHSDMATCALQSAQMLCCPGEPRGLTQGKDTGNAEKAWAEADMSEGCAGIHHPQMTRGPASCSTPTRNTSGWVAELAPKVPPLWPKNCLNPSPLPNSELALVLCQIRVPSLHCELTRCRVTLGKSHSFPPLQLQIGPLVLCVGFFSALC